MNRNDNEKFRIQTLLHDLRVWFGPILIHGNYLLDSVLKVISLTFDK